MKKTIKKDKLTIKICDTNDAMGQCAAEDAAAYLRKIAADGRSVNIIFAAAPSQNSFLSALLKLPVEWERINAFHMDEYIGLKKDAPQGFGNFLERSIFSLAPFKSVSYISECGETPDEVCEKYSEILKKNPPDAVFMGIGENAHIAFNDPNVAKFDDDKLVKVVNLDDVCRQQQVNDGCFSRISEVPKQAVTLTIPTLMSAKKIFCMVPRATKAEAVKNVYFKDIEEKYPASILRTHDDATLYCDNDSAKFIINEK